MSAHGHDPSEEELRAAYEAELARISATDMIAQATVSLLNLGARRLAPADGGAGGGAPDSGGGSAGGRDLEQARDAIDAARALLAIVERRVPPGELAPLREALAQLQMAYAREAAAPAPAPEPSAAAAGGGEGEGEGDGGQPAGEEKKRPGPAEASGRLWVPGR